MKKEIEKKYSNDEITVVWKPNICSHAKLCWKNLSTVFDPEKRPWINIEGADSKTIMNQVDQCPSGALSYYKNNETTSNDKTINSISGEVTQNGPLIIKGPISLKLVDGSEKQLDKVTAFCRCGHSNNKPFCDGAHVKVSFKE